MNGVIMVFSSIALTTAMSFATVLGRHRRIQRADPSLQKNRLRPKPFEISLFHVEENFRQSTQKELWPRLRNRHQHRILHGNRCHILDEIDVPRHDKRFFSLKPCRLNPSSDAMVAQTRGRDTGSKSFRLVVLERGIRALLRR